MRPGRVIGSEVVLQGHLHDDRHLEPGSDSTGEIATDAPALRRRADADPLIDRRRARRSGSSVA